ncbi:MAG: hypothetical protein AAB392_00070 [Patescibacteria group bacterium]
MTKTILSLLVLATSVFGQDMPTFKDYFDRAVKQGTERAAEIEQLIPVRDKAFTDLSEALNNPTPLKVRESFDRAWDAELKMGTMVFGCKSGAEQIRDNAKTALEYNQITRDQANDGIKLASRMELLAKTGDEKSEQLTLHAKMINYAFKESDRVIDNLKKAVDARKKAAEELTKKIAEDNKVKIEVYADRMMAAHTVVIEVAKSGEQLRRLLYHSEYEWKENRINEKQYDKAQQIMGKIKAADEMRWAPKDQLTLYGKVRGEAGLVEMVMK